MKLEMTACAAAAALLCAASAAASDADIVLSMPTVTVNGTADSSLGLARQNTTASRLGLNIEETPASIEALDAETIRARGDLKVKDAITRTTGLTDSSSPGNGISYSSRGFNGNSSVAMLENGQRLLVGAGTATYPSDPWGYEYIEVLRGPGSIVHGSGTTGATVNAVRKAPQRTATFEALAGIGGGNALRGAFGGTGALGEKGAFRVDAAADRSDGFIDRGEARHGKVLTSAVVELAPGVDLAMQLDHTEQKPRRYFGTPLVNGGIDGRLRRQNYNVGDALIKYVDDKGVLRLDWRAMSGLSVSNELAYMKARRNWHNVERYAFDAAANLVKRSDYIAIQHDQEHTGNRLEANWVGGAHRVVTGWEVATISFKHSNNSPYGGSSSVAPFGFDPGVFSSPDPFRPNYTTDTVTNALYAEDAYALNEQWLLHAGWRHDRYRVTRTSLLGAAGFMTTLHSNAVRLGATWKLAAGTSLYGQASTGSDPIGSLLSMNLAGSCYKLTRSRQIETGIKQSLAQGKAEWTAALYRITKDDILTRDPVNPALSVQGGSQSSRGAEFTASAALAPGWRFDANAAYTDAQFDELLESGGVSRAGKRPANVPKVSANAWLSHRGDAWRAAAGLRYVGKRFVDHSNVQALPACTTVDASLGWNVSRKLQLQFNLRNLTDKLYALTSYGGSQYLLGDRRHAELTVQWQY